MKTIIVLISFYCLFTPVHLYAGIPDSANTTATASDTKVPLIYCTDLFYPPEDPDDHYDLAMLALMQAFDLKAFVFDFSASRREPEDIGVSALKQISEITGDKIPPYAVGLRNPLLYRQDKGYGQPEKSQAAVELIINTLRESKEKVTVFSVGSCRDIAAAFNREPELLKNKISALYINAGNGPDGLQFEWNVMLDPYSYMIIMESGLPIYWCPCFSEVNLRVSSAADVEAGKAFNTYFVVPDQSALFRNSSNLIKNYISYALSNSNQDPIEYLKRDNPVIPSTPRNMWCTGPFLHAAGWNIYKSEKGYIACSEQQAANLGIKNSKIDVFSFDNVVLEQTDQEYTKPANPLCYYMGCLFDRVGLFSLERDGRPDCHVKISGLKNETSVSRVVIVGPENIIYDYPQSAGNRALAIKISENGMDCLFSPGKDGEYLISVYYNDMPDAQNKQDMSEKYSCKINVYPVGPVFKGELSSKDSQVKVFRYVNTEYNSIMVSVLSGIMSN